MCRGVSGDHAWAKSFGAGVMMAAWGSALKFICVGKCAEVYLRGEVR